MEGAKSNYVALVDLAAYQHARKLSKNGWEIYSSFDWKQKKILGDQLIRSIDSVGANIAEGYGRYHYLDKNKFYYNARGSLLEARHWFALTLERELITKERFGEVQKIAEEVYTTLNGLIKSQLKRKFTN